MPAMKNQRRIASIFLPLAVAACGGGADDNAGPTSPGVAEKPGHVFVIVLENKGYDRTFTADPPPSPYLAHDLPAMGQLLTHYYGTGHASLDNYVTMVSGQPPNVVTQADCPIFMDVIPGVVNPLDPDGTGIVVGQGCVYPASTLTVADQLEAAGFTWRGYMQDMGADPTRESATCGHPALNSQEHTEGATAAARYATRQ